MGAANPEVVILPRDLGHKFSRRLMIYQLASLKVQLDATARLLGGSAVRPMGPYIAVKTESGREWFVEVDPKALLPFDGGRR
jgi:hypothetical protein